MNTDCFDKYPGLKELFENTRTERRNEILEFLSNNDKHYAHLVKERVRLSMAVRNELGGNIAEFEKYMDIVYEQELYELDKVYSQGFCDAVKALEIYKAL